MVGTIVATATAQADEGAPAPRSVTIHIYITAFVLSMLIFAIGVYVGHFIDSSSLNDISSEVSNASSRMTSLQILLLSESNSTSFCPVYLAESEQLDHEIEDIGYKLSYLEDEKGVYDNELKKDYFMLEAESYLLSQKMGTLCNKSDVLIINFYSNKNCGQLCKDQGIAVLQARDQLVSEGHSVKLFSFDGELGSPVAEAFEAEYGVSAYPTIVINEKTYSGFQSADSIVSAVRELG